MKGREWIGLVLGLAAAIVGIWLWWANYGVQWAYRVVTASKATGAPNIAELGQTGDVFGGVNALFAALAFVGVAVAAFFQYRTLKLVQDRHHVEVFEPLFFKLLDRVNGSFGNSLLNGMGNGTSLPNFVDEVLRGLAEVQMKILREPPDEEKARAAIDTQYMPHYEHNEAALGPYFRSLYHVFSFIEESNLPDADKRSYASIARSTLTAEHLHLLMVNCAATIGKDFRSLVNKYGLLKHMPVGDRAARYTFGDFTQTLAKRLYDPTALLGSADRLAYWKVNPKRLETINSQLQGKKRPSQAILVDQP